MGDRVTIPPCPYALSEEGVLESIHGRPAGDAAPAQVSETLATPAPARPACHQCAALERSLEAVRERAHDLANQTQRAMMEAEEWARVAAVEGGDVAEVPPGWVKLGAVLGVQWTTSRRGFIATVWPVIPEPGTSERWAWGVRRRDASLAPEMGRVVFALHGMDAAQAVLNLTSNTKAA